MIKVWERNGRIDGLFVVVRVLCVLCVCGECVWTTRNSEQSQIGPPSSILRPNYQKYRRFYKTVQQTKNKKSILLVISCQPNTALIADY